MFARHLPAFAESFGASIGSVFSSPYARTSQSARFAQSGAPRASLAFDERLRELNPGVRCRLSYEASCELFPAYARQVGARGYLDVAPPFGESHKERRDGQAARFLETLSLRDTDALVVTHAGFIDCVRQIACGKSDEEMLERFSRGIAAPYGSLLVCRHDARKNALSCLLEDEMIFEPPP